MSARSRRDVLRLLAVGGAAGAAVEILPVSSASASTAAAPATPVPSGDKTGAKDTASIQSALDKAAAAGGGLVQLQPGVYTVTGLLIDSYVTLDLNGSAVGLANGANASLLKTKNYDSLVGTDSTGGPTDFEVRNGYLDGNKANQSDAGKPVVAIYGRRYVLDKLVIHDGKGTGLDSAWSSASPFLAPNGFESFVTRLYVHSCDGDGIRFAGPHDAYFHMFFVVKCGATAGAVPLNLPDSTGPANGSNFDKFHIYGGNGYSYGLVANTAGVKYTNFVVEGAQVAQVLIQAAQVKMDAFHLYPGGIAAGTVVGIQLGDSAHRGVNGIWLRGVIENLGGGALDATNCGDHNNIDLSHYVYDGSVPDTSGTGYGVVGTLPLQNTVHLDVIGPTFTKTVASDHGWHGRTSIRRTGAGDARDLLRLITESGSNLLIFDRYGRPEWQPSSGTPTVAVQSGAGSGAQAGVRGTDVAGQITVTTGTSPAGGVLAVLTFGNAWNNTAGGAPRVLLQAANLAAATLGMVSTESPSSTRFSVRPVAKPAAGTTYVWDYTALG